MKKLFFFLILVPAILVMSCSGHTEIANSDPAGFCVPDSLMLNITLDTVKTESVMGDLKLSGKISFNEDNVVKVFPQVSGHVGDVKVSLGDFVQKGQLLATIRSSDMANYYNEYKSAQSELDVAKKNMDVTADMRNSGVSSEKDYLTAQSEYRKALAEYNKVKEVLKIHTKLSQDKFVVISNGVNLKSISEVHTLDKKKIHSTLQVDDKLIIQVAGFRIEKDQKTVIRAMSYLKNNVKLLLVGDGGLRNECEKLCYELGLKDHVLFLGVRTDVPSLLKTADISVVSSHWEGFGLAAVEGMAVGKPVIASNVDGLYGVVNDAGVLFEKGNAIELAKKIETLLSDENYYKKVASACLERAKQYDIGFMVDKHIELYKKYE